MRNKKNARLEPRSAGGARGEMRGIAAYIVTSGMSDGVGLFLVAVDFTFQLSSCQVPFTLSGFLDKLWSQRLHANPTNYTMYVQALIHRLQL